MFLRVTLPTTVTVLWLEGQLEAPAVPQSVQHAGVTNPALCMGFVAGLSALTRLDEASCFFDNTSPASYASLLPVVNELSRLTGLTRLTLDSECEGLSAETCTAAGFGRALAALTGLQDLHCNTIKLIEADALCLSVLTGLTNLYMCCAGAAVSDVVVCLAWHSA